jgi:hypothetical protein
VLLERYVSREALAEHHSAPHFTRMLLGQIVPLLESRTGEEYDVPGQPATRPARIQPLNEESAS